MMMPTCHVHNLCGNYEKFYSLVSSEYPTSYELLCLLASTICIHACMWYAISEVWKQYCAVEFVSMIEVSRDLSLLRSIVGLRLCQLI